MKKSYLGSYIIILLIIILMISFFYFKKLEGNVNYNWALQNNTDYPNNDISNFSNVGLLSCKNKCFNTNGCVGIVTNYPAGSGPGACWLKSSLKSNNKTSNPARYTYTKP